jgi:hypothetical protein
MLDMAFYEIVVVKEKDSVEHLTADNLRDAKQTMSDRTFRRTDWEKVFIRQYVAGGERYRILRRLTMQNRDGADGS